MLFPGKAALFSKGIWGNGIGVVVFGALWLAKHFGIDVPLFSDLIQEVLSGSKSLPDIGLFSSLLGLWGRISATDRITSIFKSEELLVK